MAGNGKNVAPLEPAVIKTLLDRLGDDDHFRELFQKDPDAALAEAGYLGVTNAGTCLQFKEGATLASAEKIRQARKSLEKVLSVPFTYDCPAALKD